MVIVGVLTLAVGFREVMLNSPPELAHFRLLNKQYYSFSFLFRLFSFLLVATFIFVFVFDFTNIPDRLLEVPSNQSGLKDQDVLELFCKAGGDGQVR